MMDYLWLETRRQWRSREALMFRIALPTAVYLLLTAASGESSTDATRGLPDGTSRMVALAALGAVMSGLFATGPSLAQERTLGWLRQLRVTPLAPEAVVVAKVSVAMTFALPSIGLVMAAAALSEGVSLGVPRWAALLTAMWLASAPFAAIGLAIGIAVRDADAANSATTLAFLILWLLGGIFTNPGSLPDAIAVLSRALPSNALVDVGLAAARGDSIPGSAFALLLAWATLGVLVGALAWSRPHGGSGKRVRIQNPP